MGIRKSDLNSMLGAQSKSAARGGGVAGKKKGTLEEYDYVLTFNNAYDIEKSVSSFLDLLGFRILDKGYRYLTQIFIGSLSSMKIASAVKDMYSDCSKVFDTNHKCVETGIAGAIKNAIQSGRFSKINNIVSTDFVANDHVSNGMFITYVCTKFMMHKRHNQPLCFKI
jgi:hypothetical protein